MKQVTDYLEARKEQNPEFGKDTLESEKGLRQEIADSVSLNGAELKISEDTLKLTAAEMQDRIDEQLPTQKSKTEEARISKDVQRALKEAVSESGTQPLTLQDPVSAEEMAEVEMTFATDRQRRKAAEPVNLEEHAEDTIELPFVGKSGNKNQKPSRSKIKIIRNDYSSLLAEATEELKERAASEPKSEAAPAPKKFRKLKPLPEPVEETAAVEPTPAPEKPAEAKPANLSYRKLKAN